MSLVVVELHAKDSNLIYAVPLTSNQCAWSQGLSCQKTVHRHLRSLTMQSPRLVVCSVNFVLFILVNTYIAHGEHAIVGIHTSWCLDQLRCTRIVIVMPPGCT